MSASSLRITAALAAGPEAGLVNLSQGGALLEVPGRLSLGSAVRLKLMKEGSDIAVVNGRVAWQKVASISSGQINYRIAVAFDAPLEAALLADGDGAQTEPTEAEPAVETAPEPEAVPERGPAIVPFPTAQPKPQPASVPPPAPAASAADVEDLRRKLAAAKADLSCQSAMLESLAAKLKDSEQQRTALIRQLADAVTRGDDLQARFDSREQGQSDQQALLERYQLAQLEHAAALRRQQEAHEAIVAELRTANRALQAEHQALLERHQLAQQEHAIALRKTREEHEEIIAEMLKAASDHEAQHRLLFERHEQDESHVRDMEARLESTESIAAAHRDRYRALRRETEKLMKMIDAAAACDTGVEEARAAS
jgi:hypothetical protein